MRERLVSRDHLERLVQALEVPLATAGPILELDVERWEGKLPAFSCEVPGDFSAALVLLAAATLVPGSRVCARNTGLNLTRTGGLDLLRKMGAQIDVEVHAHRLGEPEGTACASHAELSATTMAGEVLARAIDDVPILAVLAASAKVFPTRRPRELTEGDDRLLQSNRAPAAGIRDRLRRQQGGLFVQGRPDGALGSADIDCAGDARLAVAASVLGFWAAHPAEFGMSMCSPRPSRDGLPSCEGWGPVSTLEERNDPRARP